MALSGGLDSRMTSLIGHKLGYTNQLNFTFSQSDYLDQTIACKIASDYNHEWIFKSLDSGKYLMNVDSITEYTGGGVLYYSLAHGYSLLKLLNLEQYGLMHSGQLGDVVLGTYYSSGNEKTPYNIKSGAFGNKLIDKVDTSNIRHYPNEEIGKFYNRGFNGILISGHTMIQQSMETASPFLDIDFMDFCLKLPVKYRRNHYIYKKWIISKHPEIAVYPWEKIKARITDRLISVKGRQIPLMRFIPQVSEALCRKLKGNGDVLMNKNHMNPIAYHIHNNPEVQNFINDYYRDNIGLVNDKELFKDVSEIVNTGSALEKIMAISLLSAIKRFKFN